MSSSEKSQTDSQMSLFESVQELAQELLKDQRKITVKSHEKTPRKSGVREEMLIGKQIVRTEVEFIQAKLSTSHGRNQNPVQ